MILIAHRGNVDGPNTNKENDPDYIDKAISLGYNVEVDVWGNFERGLSLGHDYPQYEVSPDWFFHRKDKLWIHCKELSSLYFFTNFRDSLNSFWHQQDSYTLTTKGFIWAYPGQILTPNSVCVMPETTPNQYTPEMLKLCAGICSDFVGNYK